MSKLRSSLVFLIVVMAITKDIFGQTMNRTNLFDVSFRTGMATIEKEDLYKSTSFSYGVYLLKKISLTDKSYFKAGLGVNNFLYDFESDTGNSINSHTSFIELPLNYERRISNGDGSKSFVTGLGIINRLKVNDDLTSYPDIDVDSDNGYHLGYSVNLGYRTIIYDKVDFGIGIVLSGDFYDSGYDQSTRIENQVAIYADFEFFN